MTQAELTQRSLVSRKTLWLVILITAVVVIPRSLLISQAHSESWDDQYHLERGLAVIAHQPAGVAVNDPPLGEAIEALPLYVMGIRPRDPHIGANDTFPPANNILYGQAYSPETL